MLHTAVIDRTSWDNTASAMKSRMAEAMDKLTIYNQEFSRVESESFFSPLSVGNFNFTVGYSKENK